MSPYLAAHRSCRFTIAASTAEIKRKGFKGQGHMMLQVKSTMMTLTILSLKNTFSSCLLYMPPPWNDDGHLVLFLSVHLSVILFVHPYIHPSIHPIPSHPIIRLSVHQSIQQPVAIASVFFGHISQFHIPFCTD